MKAFETEIKGVWLLEPEVFGDARGYFFESFSRKDFKNMTCLDIDFVQDNQSLSRYGVLRGLHFQKGEHAQAKLVRALKGRILDVAVDIRPGSPTFGRHIAVELSDENFRQLFIPRGFAHGFSVLSEEAVVAYKTDNYYCKEAEDAILWSDPNLAIDWKLPVKDILLSEKDKKNLPLAGRF